MIPPPSARPPTAVALGLFVALFAMPLVLLLFQRLVPIDSTAAWLAREACLFALLLVLATVVLRWERLPLRSISPGTVSVKRTILLALQGLLACAAGLALALGLVSLLGLKVSRGLETAFEPPVWALLVTIVRAGLIEEVFYRGYGIERLTALTGNRTFAAGATLALFALFHYRQGAAGILIALVMGAIVTGMYLRRRDTVANVITHFLVDFIPNVFLAHVIGR